MIEVGSNINCPIDTRELRLSCTNPPWLSMVSGDRGDSTRREACDWYWKDRIRNRWRSCLRESSAIARRRPIVNSESVWRRCMHSTSYSARLSNDPSSQVRAEDDVLVRTAYRGSSHYIPVLPQSVGLLGDSQGTSRSNFALFSYPVRFERSTGRLVRLG